VGKPDRTISAPVDYVRFERREDRSRYLLRHFATYLTESVLDVGCDQAVLKRLLPQVRYTGVDAAGTPDVRIDLDRVDRLPFEDGTFHCVVCADTLEHLEFLHAMFGELLRVSARYVVVSLPNCWVGARVPIARGRGDFAQYCLPLDPPPDRHRWFFSLEQARAFLHGQARRRGDVRIVTERVTEKPKFGLLRLARRLRHPRRMDYLNRYAHTYWCVLEKVGR
jgi:SAM-dependent methyltransferase